MAEFSTPNGKQQSKIKSPLPPGTPEWMAPLSRELESVIAQRNLLTAKTRKKVLDDLNEAAYEAEDSEVEKLRKKVDEISITVATVGDSRTGKSEMSEKMEEVLSMKGAN